MIQIGLQNPLSGTAYWYAVLYSADGSLGIGPTNTPSSGWLPAGEDYQFDLSQLGISGSGVVQVEVYLEDSGGNFHYLTDYYAAVADGKTYSFNWNTDEMTVAGGGASYQPVLQVNTSPSDGGSVPVQGGPVVFSFQDFPPNEQVWVYVQQTGRGLYVESDASGNASNISFTDNDPAGSYTLEATDAAGNVALAYFTLAAKPLVLKVTNTPVSGGEVNFSVSGCPAYETIALVINNTMVAYGSVDADGSATGSFIDTDPAGQYTLYLEDADANVLASTSFTLGASQQQPAISNFGLANLVKA